MTLSSHPQEAARPLPCPFCGGVGGRGNQAEFAWWIRCQSCHSEGPAKNTEAEGIEAWNQRAERPTPVQTPSDEDEGTWHEIVPPSHMPVPYSVIIGMVEGKRECYEQIKALYRQRLSELGRPERERVKGAAVQTEAAGRDIELAEARALVDEWKAASEENRLLACRVMAERDELERLLESKNAPEAAPPAGEPPPVSTTMTLSPTLPGPGMWDPGTSRVSESLRQGVEEAKRGEGRILTDAELAAGEPSREATEDGALRAHDLDVVGEMYGIKFVESPESPSGWAQLYSEDDEYWHPKGSAFSRHWLADLADVAKRAAAIDRPQAAPPLEAEVQRLLAAKPRHRDINDRGDPVRWWYAEPLGSSPLRDAQYIDALRAALARAGQAP